MIVCKLMNGYMETKHDKKRKLRSEAISNREFEAKFSNNCWQYR